MNSINRSAIKYLAIKYPTIRHSAMGLLLALGCGQDTPPIGGSSVPGIDVKQESTVNGSVSFRDADGEMTTVRITDETDQPTDAIITFFDGRGFEGFYINPFYSQKKI